MAAVLLRALLRSVLATPSPISSFSSSSSCTASTTETPFPAAATPAPSANDGDQWGAVTVVGEADDLRSLIFGLRLAKRSATEALEKWAGEGRAAPAPELRRIARDLSCARCYKHALEVADWMKTHHESDLSKSDYGPVRVHLQRPAGGHDRLRQGEDRRVHRRRRDPAISGIHP